MAASAIRVEIRPAVGTVYNNAVLKPQLELGSTATPFAPYSNIRPLSGWDKLNLNAAGNNLVPNFENYTMNGITMTVAADGTITLNGTSTGDGFIYLIKEFNLPAGSYALSLNNETTVGSSGADTVYCAVRDAANDWIVQAYCIQSNTIGVGTTGVGIVDFMLVVPAGVTLNNYKMAIQLEVGSAVTEWKPYQGKLHTVQIGQTVYGGKLDWLTGKLMAEWAMKTLDGTEAQLHIHDGWSDGMFDVHEFFKDAVSVDGYAAKANIICSHLPVATPADMANDRANIGVGQGQTNVLFARIGKEYNTVELIRAYLAAQKNAGTPVQIAYKLATPIEIQLTPTEIIALPGVNTLYGDGDTITAKFRQSKDVDILKRLSALETLMINQTKGE